MSINVELPKTTVHTVIADGNRMYRFTVEGKEVIVDFYGPRHQKTTTVPVQEARELYRRLMLRGFERW